MILFPDFAPDRSRYALDATSVALNVFPHPDGYGPIPAPIEVSDALPAACRGAVSGRSITNSWVTFAGTAATLQKLNTSASPYSWTDVSRLAGGAYNLDSRDRWDFWAFGQTMFATNIADVLQSINIDSGTNFAAHPGSPPQAKRVCNISEFVVLGNIANLPNYVRWSAFGDSESWTRGLGGAGQKEFPTGGEIQAFAPFENGAFVFARTAIHAMLLRPDGFDFTTINPARGTVSPYCVVPIGAGRYFYASENGFFIFDGASDYPAGLNRVDNWFFGSDSESLVSEVDRTNLADIRGTLDPFRPIVWVHYPKQTGGYGCIGYNYAVMGRDGNIGRWYNTALTVEEFVALATAGVTIGGLSALFPPGTIGDLDVQFGSRLLTGGKPTAGVFTSDHKLAFLSGGNLAATLETPDMQINPGARSECWELGVTGAYSESGTSVQVGTRDSLNGSITWSSAYSVESDSGGRFMPDGESGMYHRVRWNKDADTEWSSVTGIDPANSRFERAGKF